jgi:hypothetical protein
VLPWALLVAGSVASLAPNVAVAEPSLIGRVIAARPSFALTASFELLTPGRARMDPSFRIYPSTGSGHDTASRAAAGHHKVRKAT